ncbi:MAG: hypothetical protein HUU21_34835 [Polyangiaceae bacterium]|nr:hypothetical protein [Polyangiaceae bacterium]
MRRGLWGAGFLALLMTAAGCSGSPIEGISTPSVGAEKPALPVEEPSVAVLSSEGGAEVDDEDARAIIAQVKSMLVRVARVRGLPILREVPIRILDRPAMLVRIREQVAKDLPPELLANQGEALSAFGIVPPDYDFAAGMFRLIEGQIAGFYVPDDGTMYLADDLDEAEAEETLAHELVHALQDQSYGLGQMIKVAEGDGDRVTAAHALAEGDAMSAMLDVSVGSAFAVSEAALRRLLALSTLMSPVGATTPRFLTSSLTAPYADGFAFVQALRERDDWRAVDAAYRALPVTTEQLLHLDKLDAREPGILVAVAPLGVLGEGYRAVWNDVMGEQGLRLVLEEWSHRTVAKEAAAGWGGDRMMVARREGDRRGFAAAWRLVFDTAKDAGEVAKVLRGKFGTACVDRPEVGGFAWKSRGREVVVAAGPYERAGRAAKALGGCAVTERWAEAILKEGGPKGAAEKKRVLSGER